MNQKKNKGDNTKAWIMNAATHRAALSWHGTEPPSLMRSLTGGLERAVLSWHRVNPFQFLPLQGASNFCHYRVNPFKFLPQQGEPLPIPAMTGLISFNFCHFRVNLSISAIMGKFTKWECVCGDCLTM